MKKWLCLVCLLFSKMAVSNTPLVLDWIDLIPEAERQQFDAIGMPIIDHNDENPEQNLFGTVREELNGSYIKIPGFVIPLDSHAEMIKEFLLVPYFGACIHVPPPPLNQIIYVKFDQGAPVQELWDVVNIVGQLKIETSEHDIAQAGYTLIGNKIEPYVEEDIDEGGYQSLSSD